MGKTAILFPGQGSQELGMGRDLFKKDQFFRSLIDMASDITGENLEEVCLNGPVSKLVRPHLLQPLIVSISLGYFKQLQNHGIRPQLLAGHSLGEITALAAADVITSEDAVRIATRRGQLMEQVAQKIDGGMIAVMFADIEEVRNVLKQMEKAEKICIANDNAPGQVVLSGELNTLEQFTQKGIGKCLKVKVAGPWHSSYMNLARIEYENWVKTIRFNPPETTLVLNAPSKTETDPEKIKTLHIGQLTNAVYWRESMELIRQRGVETIFEVGPGKVLKGLARANGLGKNASLVSIDSYESITEHCQEVLVN
ncbi:Malonyl CoA-acyl carrier protein transacylase [Chitinispirillum alkaliphilum]|nr:Malonyl CoA-acyl carrier protein transacylase [Chitinispirillum alkaliphilum]